jgi:hypothetical protein
LSELFVRSTTRTTGLRVAGAWAKYLRDAGHHSAQSVRNFYKLPSIWDIGNAGQKTTPASEKKFERFAYLAWLFASESWTAVCVSG